MSATKLGKNIMLDSYTGFMCMEFWGRGSFAHALIELDATCGLKDKPVVVIPKFEANVVIRKSQGKSHCSGFNKSTNGSYIPVEKSKSSTLASNPCSALEEDNDNSMDDLVDDIRKNVKAPPRKTGIWLGRKADSPKKNIVFCLKRSFRDDMIFDEMGPRVKEVDHGNASSENG
ncbi:hypothetical protein Tco_1004160 [Tanacetum coccineum]|uniref:Uncharacterized protein n=1 Tax=Tanacetum coccineum TaxID=301880 RepID=A0ABQ5FD06_9ASTR